MPKRTKFPNRDIKDLLDSITEKEISETRKTLADRQSEDKSLSEYLALGADY